MLARLPVMFFSNRISQRIKKINTVLLASRLFENCFF